MSTRPLARRAAAGLLAAGTAGLLALAAPSAEAAAGVFVWTGPGGDNPVPFPADDQCIATPGATAAKNFTVADGFLFTDANCTLGMEAGDISAFQEIAVGFESVRLRTPAS